MMMQTCKTFGGVVETMGIAAARASLSRLIARLERGELDEVVITRGGRPVARLVPMSFTAKRLGIARGVLAVPDNLDASDEEVARLFSGE